MNARGSLFSFLLHSWKPKAEAVYCWVGAALAITGGSFPMLSYHGTRHVGYGMLAAAIVFQFMALICLLPRLGEDDG